MNIKFKDIVIIIVTSSVIGFAYNWLNPSGIPLIKKERVINFEEDGLTNSIRDNEFIDESQSNNHNEIEGNNNHSDNTPANISLEEFSEPIAIKLSRALDLYEKGIIFIDARTKEEFAEGHIKGAVNIPFYESEHYNHVLDKIDKSKIVVTYCSGSDCDLSIMLGDELFEKGYKKVYVFYGGWDDWLKSGYPTESLMQY
jgi:rhodanese-related sulfurtransferase